MATDSSLRTFMSSKTFAVVGASSDPAKFGHKIFKWYTHHDLPVTPINPSATSITALPPGSRTLQTYDTLPSLSSLPDPTNTSVSIITPPKVTLKVLQEAKKLGIPAVWLQPGSFDDEGLKFALQEENFKAALGGDGGWGSEGWCVLVDGERGLAAAGREGGGKGQRL